MTYTLIVDRLNSRVRLEGPDGQAETRQLRLKGLFGQSQMDLMILSFRARMSAQNTPLEVKFQPITP